VKWALTEIAFLQDGFHNGLIPALFLDEDLFSDNPSKDVIADFLTWVQVSAFHYGVPTCGPLS